MRKWLAGILVAIFPGFAPMAGTPPALKVQVTDGRLAVHSEGAPLYGVLWAISAQTGVRLNIVGDGFNEGAPVVEDFVDRPPMDVFVYLLKEYLVLPNYMLITSEQTGDLETVHVFADAFGTSRISATDSPALPREDNETQPVEARKQLEDDDAAADPLNQVIALQYDDSIPDEQNDDQQVLGNAEGLRTLEGSQLALRSVQPTVRLAALGAISQAHADSAELLAEIHSLATGDPEAAVRYAAVMVLTRHDDSSLETRALVEALAHDESVPDHEFFRHALNRIDEETAARSLPDTQSQLQ